MAPAAHHRHNDAASSRTQPKQGGDVSRRVLLAGAAATTAVAAALPLANSAYAEAPNPSSNQDMMAFLLLSAALAGVRVASLAPEFALDAKKDLLDQTPTVDPFNLKDDYFNFINAADKTSAFGKLLQIAKDHSDSAADIVDAVNKGDDDIKFLARSIVLLWYLGSWYKPDDLKDAAAHGITGPIPSEVVSAKAYTQGLVWQIAQAHPMGYSNLQFGYWSRDPSDPNNPNDRSNLGVISPTIP